jgi:hypothetical protein
MQKHFNPSLSPPWVQKWNSNTRVKARIRVTVSFAMTNGGFHQHGSGEAIIISRTDVEYVHDWAWKNASLRDFLIIRLPMKIGLRTFEISTLRAEFINFENRRFQVLDSKKHKYYPLLFDRITLDLIIELLGGRREGYVLPHMKNWEPWKNQPLSKVTIWKITRRIARLSGIKNWEEHTPRLGRHYFVCKWLKDMKMPGSKKTVIGLQRYVRHINPGSMFFYTRRLYFIEDLDEEFSSEERQPFADPETARGNLASEVPKAQLGVSYPLGSHGQLGDIRSVHQVPPPCGTTICNGCSNLALCQSWTGKSVPLPSCVSVCRFKTIKKEVMEK